MVSMLYTVAVDAETKDDAWKQAVEYVSSADGPESADILDELVQEPLSIDEVDDEGDPIL